MNYFRLYFIISLAIFTLASCSDDDTNPTFEMTSFDYQIHNGQTVNSAAYAGTHSNDFNVNMELIELSSGNTQINLTLNNTMEGETYHIHAHDAADPATTPNGTPYNETPNGDIFAQMVVGNGGSVSISQEASSSFTELTNDYEGFFVVHDPLQAISTTDISTYLVVASFARAQSSTSYESKSFNYDFNTGQLVEDFAYSGTHNSNLTASIQVDELAGNQSRIIVRVMNSMNGEVYHTHAHDMADPASTPNGTPYNETPNGDVFASAIEGNGGTASKAYISSSSYSDITSSYDGFFVIHDPLQAISTTDPTTYVILGVFAR